MALMRSSHRMGHYQHLESLIELDALAREAERGIQQQAVARASWRHLTMACAPARPRLRPAAPARVPESYVQERAPDTENGRIARRACFPAFRASSHFRTMSIVRTAHFTPSTHNNKHLTTQQTHTRTAHPAAPVRLDKPKPSLSLPTSQTRVPFVFGRARPSPSPRRTLAPVPVDSGTFCGRRPSTSQSPQGLFSHCG